MLNPESSVASDHPAKVGAAKLDSFLNGVGASHEVQARPLHLTALGHSYGSLTTGIALRQQTPVDDAVVFGSPGLDAHRRTDLQVAQGHLYSADADQDWVPRLDIGNHFGASPYQDAPLSTSLDGVDRMSTSDAIGVDGLPRRAIHTHGQYLEDRSTSQYNMSVITAGRPDLQVRYMPPPR